MIKTALGAYCKLFPGEAAGLRLLGEQLGRAGDVTARDNFVGHVTVSGFVVDESSRSVLLLKFVHV